MKISLKGKVKPLYSFSCLPVISLSGHRSQSSSAWVILSCSLFNLLGYSESFSQNPHPSALKVSCGNMVSQEQVAVSLVS